MNSSSWTPSSTALTVFALTLANGTPVSAAALAIASNPDGSLAITDGARTVASFTPKAAKAERGPATVRELTVSGHAVVEARMPLLGAPTGRHELWLAERAAGGPKVIWWGVAGPTDADGETSLEVKATEQGIEESQTAARLSRCDGAPVPLFRRTWDFGSRAFRTTAPELPARGGTSLTAHRGNAPVGKPLGGYFFTAASSAPGARSQASQLRPPAAVNDGKPETVWSTQGSGRGHLLTARSSSGFAITGLRLLPGDTSSEARFRASAKPRRLALIFGRDAAQNVEVDLADDADGGARRFREPFWIALPKPVLSSCVTVLVRDVTSEQSPMAIANLEVMTELDGPAAADRLVASLAQGTSCQARLPLLVRLGAPALAKLSAAIAAAPPGGGRGCLLEALDGVVTAGTPLTSEAAGALVSAIERATPDEEKLILKLLPAMTEPPIARLATVLADEKRPDQDRARAARVLAAIDQTAAQVPLFAAVGRGSRELRKDLRDTVSSLHAAPLATALAQLETTPTAQTARRADLLAIVGVLAARAAGPRAPAVAALRAPLESHASFEEQARAIQGLGQVHDPGAVAELVAVREQGNDGVLRSLAMAELVNADGPTVLPALRAALQDNDPVVRETAVGGLGVRGDKDAAPAIVAGAKQEPWPQVRRAEIEALGELCTSEGNQLLLRAFQKDVEDVRQTALRGIAHCYQEKATGTLLRTLGRLPESADLRSLAARLLAARKDPRTVPGLVEVLSRLLTESQADLSLEGVIADTAMALATIANPPAVDALAKLASDARPSVRRIAIDALGVVCDPGAGAKALRAAALATDASVAAPAAAAEAHCRERR